MEFGFELHGLFQVISADFDELRGSVRGQRLHLSSDARVQLGAACLRQRRVGDVAHQDVLETIERLSARHWLLADKVTQNQVFQRDFESLGVIHQVVEHRPLKGASDHGPGLERPTLARG